MNVQIIYENHCFLCGKENDCQLLNISKYKFSVHLECWKIHSGNDELIHFSLYNEWFKFAGSRWDFRERCVVGFTGNKSWYLNNELHRKDGPAIEFANGEKHWYKHGQLHRENMPACEYVSGDKFWYFNGKRHREDGPAIEYVDGKKTWWINGEQLTEKEFDVYVNNI